MKNKLSSTLGWSVAVGACFFTALASAHPLHSHGVERKIEFPDIPRYCTLKTDFHQHTALSDGNVWPPIWVEEAARDGLGAISLTEHLDRNCTFQIAGSLIFWNHLNWIRQSKTGEAKLPEMRKKLIADGLLNGIEVEVK